MTIPSVLLLILMLTATSQASGLHGECKTDENCGVFDTHCKNGTCLCKEHFTGLFDTCIQLATPTIKCTKRHDCHEKLGPKSVCKHQKCGCKSFHHIHEGSCVKSRGVEEVCEHDHQCYCGQNCQQGIECFQKICTCRKGFVQESRKCIPIEPPPGAPVPSPFSPTELSTMSSVTSDVSPTEFSEVDPMPPPVLQSPSLAQTSMVASSSTLSVSSTLLRLIAVNFLYHRFILFQ